MEEKKGAERHAVPGTGEQYLYALIRCASWVERPYKLLAEKQRQSPEILRELYLCACDGIPMEKAQKALEECQPREALQLLRKKQVAESMDIHRKELEELKKNATGMEKEVRQMSLALQHMAEQPPEAGELDELFPEGAGMEPEDLAEEPTNPETEWKGPANGQPAPGKRPNDPPGEKAAEKHPLFLWRKRRLQKEREKKNGSVSAFLERVIKEGYTPQQIDFLLNCIGEGMNIREIEQFASPRLPVEVMQRLRQLQERKEEGSSGI